MGLFKSIFTWGKGKANEADEAFRSANMETMMNQNIRDQKSQVSNIKSAVAKVIAQAKQQEAEAEKYEAEVKRWQSEAVRSAKSDRADLAKSCLEKKAAAQANLDKAKAAVDASAKQRATLEGKLKSIERKVKENETQAATLIARKKTADAMHDANKAMAGIDGDGAFASFDKFENDISSKEAEAAAFDELSDLDGTDSLEDELATLGASNTDDELAKLMAKHSK